MGVYQLAGPERRCCRARWACLYFSIPVYQQSAGSQQFMFVCSETYMGNKKKQHGKYRYKYCLQALSVYNPSLVTSLSFLEPNKVLDKTNSVLILVRTDIP